MSSPSSPSKPLIPPRLRYLLESKALAHVATIGPRQEPQVNPVWFDWDGEHLLFSQTRTRQKVRNLQRNPRIALSIVDPDDPYMYIEIRGIVVDIEDDPDNLFIDAMSKKYLGSDKFPWHEPGDERVVVKVLPERAVY